MPNSSTQLPFKPIFLRLLELWPYMLIAISIAGFTYLALNKVRWRDQAGIFDRRDPYSATCTRLTR